jgi:hypothetical protein
LASPDPDWAGPQGCFEDPTVGSVTLQSKQGELADQQETGGGGNLVIVIIVIGLLVLVLAYMATNLVRNVKRPVWDATGIERLPPTLPAVPTTQVSDRAPPPREGVG